MNDKLKQIYELYRENGLVGNATFEDFAKATPEQQQAIWELGAENGLVGTTEPDEFKAVFEESKPKEPGFFDRAMSGISDLFSSDDDVKKKAASTASSSGKSLSALPSKPKDEFQLAAAKMRGEFIPPTGTLEEQAKSVAGQDSYMGMTVPKEKTYAGQQEVKKQFEQQQQIAASEFDESVKGTADFNRALSNINKEMMDFDEEDITPKLQGLFGLYGYKFDYATDAREAVEVTAPNGKKKTIPVDAFTEAGDIESANEFKAFINANKPTLRQTTEQPFYQDRNYNRILNEEEAKQQMANINKITERQDRLNSDLQSLSINKAKLAKELNGLVVGSPEYLKKEQQLNQLDNSIAETNKLIDYFNKQDKPLKEKLMASMGSYTRASAEQGGLLAASYNSALSATGGILAGLNDMVGFLSSRMMEDATPEEKDASYKMVKERSPIIRESLLKAYGITSVSEEYLAAAQQDFLKRNVLGAAAFIPQLAGMAAAPETAIPLFFLGGYDGAMEKMDNNPNFKKVSEEEKFAVATTSGVINTVLMRYNIGEKILETTAGKTLMGNILKGIGSKTGATTIEEVVDNEVKGALSRGLITAAAGAGHGFSLGAQIKAGEIASEELYNKMKEEKLFDTPETFTEAFHQVMESGLDMAMGSVLLGVPKTFQKSLKENNYEGITSDELEILNAYANSSEFLEFKKAQIGQKVASREITKEQGVQEIAALETNISIYKSIPENLSDAGKRKAMGLLSEKRQLDSFIQGKDKALVKKQIDRIAEINKQLEALPDMKEEAPAPATSTPSYSINGKEMSEADFSKAISEMPVEEVKKADIKATNASESVTNLLKNIATRSGVESAPMMETTAPTPAEAPAAPEAQPASKQIGRGDLKISVDGTTQGLGNIISENYSEKQDGTIKDKRFSVNSRNPVKVESTVKDNGNTELNVVVFHPDNVGRQGAVQFKIEIPKGVEVDAQEIENIVKEKTKQIKLDPRKDFINYKKGVESYLNDIVDNIIKPKENAIQEPTTEESVLRTEQPEVELPTMGEGNAQETTAQEGVAPAKPEEVKPIRNLDESSEQNKGTEISNLKKDINKGLGKDMEIAPEEVKELDKLEFTVFPKDDIDKSDTDKPIILIRKRGTPELSVSEALEDAQEGKGSLSDYFEIVDGRHRIKKALSNGEKLKAVVVTEAEYEKATGTKLYSEETKNILGDLGVKTIEQGIAELENVKSKTEYKKQFGRDLAEDLSILEEEQQQRDLLDKPEAKPEEEKPTEAKSEVDELLNLDTKDKTNLQKVYDFLDKADKDLTKFSKENLGVNIAIPVMKAIVKSLKVLVKGGMTLQEAITKVAADNNVSFDDVVKGMKSLAETVSAKTVKGYKKMMEDVNTKILDGLNRKAKNETILANVMKVVESSEAYKNATDQQREQMVRDVKEAFGEKMKEAPSAEKITGKEDKAATENANKLKDQIKLEAKAAKEGASSVKTAIKKIRDFVVNNKETANLTRKDLLKVIDIMKSVNDEKSLEKATAKVLDIIDKANKDIIEVSKTKMDAEKMKAELKANKEKMKAELKAAKDSAKGVVNKIKAVKAYFDSVQEYGNLTRKDLRRIMKEMASVKDEASLDKAVNNINDIIDNATSDKIEISEKKMIANTIKEVKLAKGNIKEKRKMIADVIDEIKKSGKLTASQVNALLKKANRLNVESFEHLNKFIEYTEKLFADAEYDNKLSKANAERASIRKSSKNKGNKYDANLVRLAERFLTIDPSLVENIDEYNKMASDIAQAIKGSSAKAFKPTVEIKTVDAYIEETMKAQKEKLTEMMREQVEELLGVDGSTLTYDEMIKMMESEKKDMSEQKEKIIRSAAIKLFESLSSNIEYILEKGKDPFTGEDVDIKQSKKDVVKRFMEMDLRKMDIKDAIAAVDALNNFIVNQSTAKMDDVVSKYEGRQNNAELNSKGIVSKPLRLYFNKYIGRVMLEQFANLPIVFERLFKSPAMGAYVQKMMGVTDLINNKSKAEAIVKSAVNKFTEKFYKDKANGENFNSSFNNLERGVFADLYRTVIGTPEQVKQEFERNKGLLEQTIKKLSRGTESQKKESEILQKVYDKIVKDSDSIEDVKSKMDAKNVEAVEYWVEKWAEHYEDLADVSENVYNRILDKELNYTPKRMSKIKEDNSLETEESAFHKNNGTLFKKSTGSLMEATRPDELPENRYVDYSFDSKMANSFQDALVDIYTAANVRKVEAFIKDKGFEDIFPNAEDRVLLEKRIKLMVDNFRNKNHYDYNELSKGMKYVNKLGNIGVAAALGGVFQPIKQTVPVAINTLVNAGGINMDRLFSKSYRRVTNEFLDKSGYAIANRGKESTSDIKAIDTMIEDVATNAASKGVEWTTKKLGKIQDFYLKKLLVNPDVGIARISWLTYYEKSLKEQGKDVENIDYSDHELNKEAADYAQKMVDRQQNISDADLKGEFFSNKSAANQFISKIIFPFASFRMNQSARLASDFITLTSKTASEQDRRTAARSLAGASAEIAAFNAIGAGLTTLLYSGVKSLMADDDEDEEDKKKREEANQKYIDMIIKGRATSAVQDFLSPLPFADYLVQKGVYNTIDVFNGEEKKGKKDEQFNILKPRGREGLQSLGTLGIFPLRMYDLYSITSMASSGTFEDDYGNTKNIREKDKGVLKNVLIPLAAINSTGALPAESYTVQNMILKDIKKRASTQTEAEIIQAKAKKREQRADNIEKIQVINRAINVATDQDVVNELMKMKRETRMELFPEKMSDEAKEVLKRKREREKASYKGLLGGYDTKTDLKRYDPDLYEQNFGENSEYGQTHKAEVKADKLFDAMMKKTKDEKYGYTPPLKKKKSKKRKKNSDGSYKSSYFRYSSN